MAKIHHSSQHKRAARALRAQGRQPCVLCGQAIDYTARMPDPLSFSAEHWPPVSQVGEHGNLEPAHLGCNRTQGGEIRAGQWAEPAPLTSGVW